MGMNRVHIYKLECSSVGCDVVRCTPHAPGFAAYPGVETEEYVAFKLDRETAELVVKLMNDAFNVGREYARQR